jgi:HK97 family phage portal protein
VKLKSSFFQWIPGLIGYLGGAGGGGWYPTASREGVAPFRATTSDAGPTVGAGIALQLSAVWACVSLIAETIATLPLNLYNLDAGKQTLAVDSPTFKMLRYTPNADMTATEFWEMVVVSLLLWGNAYAVKQRLGGRVVSFDPLRPEAVSVVRKLDGRIVYLYQRGTELKQYAAEDILHIKGFGVDGLVGLSPIAMARQTIGRSIATDQASGKVFTSGLSAGGFITYEKAFLTDELRAQVQGRIAEFTGSANMGKTMVLENGMGYTPITMNPSDAQMLESRLFNITEICSWFRTPPALIGHVTKNSSWASSLENTTLGWVKFCLRAYLTRIEQSVARALSLNPKTQVLKFNLEALLRGDSAARAALYTSGTQNGWLTRNEVRELEERERMGGNADVLTVQSNLLPLDLLDEMAKNNNQPADPAPDPAADPEPPK